MLSRLFAAAVLITPCLALAQVTGTVTAQGSGVTISEGGKLTNVPANGSAPVIEGSTVSVPSGANATLQLSNMPGGGTCTVSVAANGSVTVTSGSSCQILQAQASGAAGGGGTGTAVAGGGAGAGALGVGALMVVYVGTERIVLGKPSP